MNMNELNINWNLLVIVLAVILICNVIQGYKKGLVKSVITFVSLIITSIVVILLGNALKSYHDGKTIDVVIAVILLCVVAIVRHLIGVVLFSAKVISKLPVVSWLDKLFGIVFGVWETFLILWTMYILNMIFDLGMIGQWILDHTFESRILSWLYQNNYLANLLEYLSSQIGIRM